MRDNPDQALAERLTDYLMQQAEMPPERVEGVPQEFLDGMTMLFLRGARDGEVPLGVATLMRACYLRRARADTQEAIEEVG